MQKRIESFFYPVLSAAARRPRPYGGTPLVQTLTHDAQNHLTGAQGDDGSQQSWSYDGNGNLLTSTITTTDGTTTSVYGYNNSVAPNEVQAITTTGQPVTHYSYDVHGDTTAITTGSTLTTALGYDRQARLSKVTLQDGTTVVMGYNAQGQRSSYVVTPPGQSTPSVSMHFQYRNDELGQAVVTGTQTYTDTYLYTPDNLPLELLRQQGGTTSRYWYVLDGRDNVVALTDKTGNVVDRYSYDLWGAPTSASESVAQPFRYAGYWYDRELGWYWVNVRPYDPALKRWLQPDPSEQDGVRTYAYVGDNPSDRSDPSGLGSATGTPGVSASDVIDFVVIGVVAGVGAVAAIAASPALLPAAGIVLGSAVVIGGVTYIVREIRIGQPGTVTVLPYPSQPGTIQATQVAGGTTLTTPGQITLPATHQFAKKSKGRPQSNQAQNKQFRDAVKEIQHRIGRELSKDEIRRLHDALHDEENPGYDEIVETGVGLFG